MQTNMVNIIDFNTPMLWNTVNIFDFNNHSANECTRCICIQCKWIHSDANECKSLSLIPAVQMSLCEKCLSKDFDVIKFERIKVCWNYFVFDFIFNWQLWIGLGKRGQIQICNLDSLEMSHALEIPCRGVSAIITVQDKVWFFMFLFIFSTYKQ